MANPAALSFVCCAEKLLVTYVSRLEKLFVLTSNALLQLASTVAHDRHLQIQEICPTSWRCLHVPWLRRG